ncbi:Uncharacterised protein [Chlamydia trachomatis]|nr:Uncharacterised protein [Chlamydia trachomatis]
MKTQTNKPIQFTSDPPFSFLIRIASIVIISEVKPSGITVRIKSSKPRPTPCAKRRVAHVIDIDESERLPVPSSIEITRRVSDMNNPTTIAKIKVAIAGIDIPFKMLIREDFSFFITSSSLISRLKLDLSCSIFYDYT